MVVAVMRRLQFYDSISNEKIERRHITIDSTSIRLVIRRRSILIRLLFEVKRQSNGRRIAGEP